MASGGVPPSSFQFKYLEQTTAATTVSRQVHLGALLRGGLLKTILQPMAGVTDPDEELRKLLIQDITWIRPLPVGSEWTREQEGRPFTVEFGTWLRAAPQSKSSSNVADIRKAAYDVALPVVAEAIAKLPDADPVKQVT